MQYQIMHKDIIIASAGDERITEIIVPALSIDLREIEIDLRQIKGIGDKRVEEIMAVIEKHLRV